MSANSPDKNSPSTSSTAPADDAGNERRVGVANLAAAYLDHISQVVLMIELIDRLPDLAEDVRNWRPRSLVEYFRGARASGAIDDYSALDPVARHAFDAVAAGLNTLGLAAAALCGNAQGRLSPDEIEACREIGVVMGRLLERATALIETADGARSAAARAGIERTLARDEAGRPAAPGSN